MTTKQITIGGLDEFPMAKLVQVASKYDSRIHIEESNRSVNAKSIMGMMALKLDKGDSITITAEGADEAAAVEAIEAYLNSSAS